MFLGAGHGDDDLELEPRELLAEAERLRTGIPPPATASGHDLCWQHPEIWGLLPEKIPPESPLAQVPARVDRYHPRGDQRLFP